VSYDPWGDHERRFPPKASQAKLNRFRDHCNERSAHYIGFPNSRLMTFLELTDFLKFNINNIGDPYHPNAGINTCDFERELIDFWACQLHLDPDKAWGYVTNGSTEGIMYGIAQGRDRFEDAVLLFSEESHYCLYKIAHLLRLPHRVIPSLHDGTLDLEALRQLLEELAGRPVILNLTVGTTFHGAIESPIAVLDLLDRHHCHDRHLHIDAALYGPMFPFLQEAPIFDFRLPIHTLSFSGHKFLGSPIPCGLVLSHREPIRPYQGSAEYVGSLDTTISGSRDGFSALILWHVIQRLGVHGLTQLAGESIELAVHAAARLELAGFATTRHHCGNIVVFARPCEAISTRWQLANRGDQAHIVTVPGVTDAMLEQFVDEMVAARSDEAVAGTGQPFSIAGRV
jgi:histidine decarboxylase